MPIRPESAPACPAVIAAPSSPTDAGTHDGKGQDLDAELPGQELQSLLNPGFAMVKVLARDRILPAQEGAPDCTLNAVINADFRFFNQVSPRQSKHGRFSTRVLCEVAEV